MILKFLRRSRGLVRDSRGVAERGVTLLELLVAMLILAMVSVMLYSVLNVAIGFSSKGEARARQAGREHAFLELLHRQVQGTWYDRKQKKVLIESLGHQLTMVTTAPLLNRDQGLVLAVYLYDPADDVLYYTEKKDFYKSDYRENYQADRREMLVLMTEVGDLALDYQDDDGLLKVTWRGHEHAMPVRCWLPKGG
ncbi:MAG TPA: prepilin-type N-terminal cleavage/methylation domain-containing protein [Desulfurivibrionaceae bacterium]|nr:prepilin-type N-terminal cleavage/methylation domain-containing protein [Desulfurivibrionaceae bacterium]